MRDRLALFDETRVVHCVHARDALCRGASQRYPARRTPHHAPDTMTPIARLRFLGATMLGAWIALNIVMYALKPLTHGMHPLASTALVVPPMVLMMVYLIIPAAKRA